MKLAEEVKKRFNERYFREQIKPHLMKCRDGDWNHAKRVAKWTKKIGKEEKNLYLLIITAYIHDIGWREVLPPQKLTFDKLLEYERQANHNSEPYIREVLRGLGYSERELETVLRLVRAADKHKSQTEDEAIIVDADNLSKLDVNHLKEKYVKDDWVKMYRLWKKEFPQRIKTELGKKSYPHLLVKLKANV